MRLALQHASWAPICHGNLGACFTKLGMTDSAIHYLTKSVEGSTGSPGLAHNREWALVQLGLAYLQQGDARRAIALCSEALSLSLGSGDLADQELCYQCLYKAHEARGDAPDALRMLKQWNLVRDTLLGVQREKEIMRSELVYGFERQMLADSLTRLDAQRREEIAYQERIARERDQKRIFLFSAIGILLVAGGLWSRLRYIQRSRRAIKQERDRSDALLLNILPARIAEELKATGHAPAREVQGVSILFTDFHEFTRLSERMSPTELVAEIDACFKAFDAIAARHRLEKIKTIGDAYMCAGGLPDPRPGSARDAVLAALEMQDWLMERGAQRDAQGLPFFRMRAGIHTGTVVAGIVGESKFQYDVWGDAVNTAARMEAAGQVGEVNISEATFLLIRDEPGLGFRPRGRLQAKGKGELAMFFARREARHEAASAPASPPA
jgi:class 3 adenylate cyclase